MHKFLQTWSGKCACGALVLGAVLSACGGGSDQNHLYAQTNTTANAVVHMVTKPDGTLGVRNTVNTGGAGSNTGPDPLTSQYSVITTPDSKTLFAVNAGDNSVSSFSIDRATGDLTLLKRTATTGSFPVSLAYRAGYLFVLFQGSLSVQSYPVQAGVLGAPVGSYPILNAQVQDAVNKPTEIVLSPNGDYLLVSAGTRAGALVSLPVQADGSLGAAFAKSSDTPFAAAFANDHTLLVTDVAGHALQSMAYSMGVLTPNGSPVLGNPKGAPCWLSITPNGKFAYVGDGGSGTIDAYAIGSNGTLTLLSDHAANENIAVAGDSWISKDGKYLYSAYLAAGVVIAYSIGQDGSLTKLGGPVQVTPGNTMQGLAGI